MADDTGNVPEGPLGQDFWDIQCFPGRLLTFVLTDCTNGAPILLFSATDAQGNGLTSNNGRNLLAFCTLPGYQFTVSAGGYTPLTVSVTREMFDDRQVVLCMMPLPKSLPPPTRGKWCFVAAAAGVDLEADDAFLDMARAFRSIMRTGARGGAIMDAYESEESDALLRKLAKDASFMARTTSVALRAMPVVARIVMRAGADVVGRRRLGEDERLSRPLASDILDLLKDIEERTGPWALLPLVAEAVRIAERRGILASLLDDQSND